MMRWLLVAVLFYCISALPSRAQKPNCTELKSSRPLSVDLAFTDAEAKTASFCFEFATEQLMVPIIVHRRLSGNSSAFVLTEGFSQRDGERGMSPSLIIRASYKGYGVDFYVPHAPYEFLSTFGFRAFYGIQKAGTIRQNMTFYDFNLGTTLTQSIMRAARASSLNVQDVAGALSPRDQHEMIKFMFPLIVAAVSDQTSESYIPAQATAYVAAHLSVSPQIAAVLADWWLHNARELDQILRRAVML